MLLFISTVLFARDVSFDSPMTGALVGRCYAGLLINLLTTSIFFGSLQVRHRSQRTGSRLPVICGIEVLKDGA